MLQEYIKPSDSDLGDFNYALRFIEGYANETNIQELLDMGKNEIQKVLLWYQERIGYIIDISDLLSFEILKQKEPNKMHLLSHILGGKFTRTKDVNFSAKKCKTLASCLVELNETFAGTL